MPENDTNEPKDIGVRHYKNGRGSWQVGYRHYWLRLRGLITAVIAAVLTMGVPWWWPTSWAWQPFPDTVTFSLQSAAVILAAGASFIVFILFLYARGRAQRSLDCKDKLHSMSHLMRDTFCELLERTGSRKSKHVLANEKKLLLYASNAITQSIVDYYGTLTGAKCIGVVLRLAEDQPDDGKDEIHYVAVGRAGSTNKTRGETSEPILAGEGIPKLFSDPRGGTNGILFFHDLDLAKRFAIYKETKNENDFPDDYKYVIAIPLNGYNGSDKGLIGILTITSRSRKILRLQHLDLLKAIGDRLAEHYSATLARLAATNRMPDLQ